MCKWKSKYSPDYQCDEPPLGGDPGGYCLLHSEDNKKDLDAFRQKVEERIIATTGDKIDLKGCYFPRNLDKGYFRGYQFNRPVDFSEAKFSQEADFGEATFSQGADFSWAEFSQANFFGATFSQVDFTGAKFSQWAGFSGAEFSQGADFSEATFSQQACFIGAKFSQWANFSEAEFSQEADFIGAKFSQGAKFNWVKFSQADFGGAKFSQAHFFATRFEEGVRFDLAEFGERVFFIPGGIEGEERDVYLGPGSSFNNVRFLGDIRFQKADLSHCSFLHSNIDQVDFRYCEFAEKEEDWPFCIFSRRRQNVLRDELEADSACHSERSEESRPFAGAQGDRNKKLLEEKYEPVRRLYLELKRNFEDKKDWNTAGDFHYGEMECRRKGRLGGRLDRFLVNAYYWASGYGERPWRALLWWFFSTLLFFPFLCRLSEHDPLSACVWDSVRVATFMKIGTPIEPESWGRIVLTLQYFICPTLLALFALALRRKVKR